jgi:Ca2+-transporting ATPase
MERGITFGSILLAQFRNVLILILIAACVISGFLGHAVETVVIAVIVGFSVALGCIQEYRAERALEALRRMAAPTARVVREGSEQTVAARDLVPGDIVLLGTGDRIPADLRLISAVNLQVDESPLTGESFPVEKDDSAVCEPAVSAGDRRNIAHSGTAVTRGRGRGVVVATAMDTEFGRIAQLLQSVETGRTPLQEDLDRLGRRLGQVAGAIVVAIVAIGLHHGHSLLDMFLFGIALAVAVVPEALPAVITISLAIGVQRLVRRNALMRRLPAVETLGCTTVICSDKTGTLTRDEMTVRRVLAAGREYTVSGAGYEPVSESRRHRS